MTCRRTTLGWLGFVIALCLTGCPGAPVTPDGGERQDAGPLCDAPEPFTGGDPVGHADPLGAAPGEARAGRVAASDLPVDPSGLATWAEGDYVLANDRFALVVSSTERFEVYDPHGGRVRGLARVEAGALVAPADFNLGMLGLGRLVIGTESVTVLADGSDGGAAILRVAGTLAGIDALGPLLDSLFPSNFEGLPAVLDYVLEPGADTIDVRITIRTASAMIRVPFGTAAFFQSFRMPGWNEGGGFAPAMGAQRFVIFEDPDATSYAWVAAPSEDGTPGTFSPILSMGGFDFFTSTGEYVPPCTERSYEIGRFAIGEADGMNGVQTVVARVLGTTSAGCRAC
jgi:hypothetical protein